MTLKAHMKRASFSLTAIPAGIALCGSVILAGLKETPLGLPRDGRITEPPVTLIREFLWKIGTLKATIPACRACPSLGVRGLESGATGVYAAPSRPPSTASPRRVPDS